MTDREKLEQLLSIVIQYEDHYYDIAGKALDKNNMMANMIHSAEAGAFQRMRYAIENAINE